MIRKYLFPIITVIIAAVVSSQNPDGLESVSKMFGLNNSAKEGNALLAGYQIPFLGNNPLSSALAGIAGILTILLISHLATHLIKKLTHTPSKQPAE